jgi:hypothetical protein
MGCGTAFLGLDRPPELRSSFRGLSERKVSLSFCRPRPRQHSKAGGACSLSHVNSLVGLVPLRKMERLS